VKFDVIYVDLCRIFAAVNPFISGATARAPHAESRETDCGNGRRGFCAALLKNCRKPAFPQPLKSANVLQWPLFSDQSFHA
jgi:hypothetical protein